MRELLVLVGILNVFLLRVRAAITVYSQQPLGGTQTASGAAATYTGAAAYDPTVLTPPPVPVPGPNTQFAVQLQDNAASVSGLSLPVTGSFWGFSIEMSVINQVLGINASFIQVPFLNLMANIQERAGFIRIRVGGNTQETATLVDSLESGKMMEKQQVNSSNPTDTPALLYTPEVIYLLSNISSLVNVKWFLGVPLNDTSNLRLQIAELGQDVLGDNLLGLQVGNEPDLYAAHLHRPSTYSPTDYHNEFGIVRDALAAANGAASKKMIGPSLATGDWQPQQVWDTNFIPDFQDNLAAVAMEHYPDNNCNAQFGTGTPVDPQSVFVNYLDHNAGKNIISIYLNSTPLAQSFNKPFFMFETNTASCGGFAGISNSFGSALWALDYGLQMAYSNFSAAFLHIGGQNVFYNPFTPPPTNQSTFRQWTIGPVYYSTLIVAEAFGKSNASQIIDLNANDGDIHTPAYAIYDGGKPSKLAFFNFITDPSGASDYTASVTIGGAQLGQANGTPAQVKVKYLLAPSVSEKVNITWAGQTFGPQFSSDGRITGNLDIRTVDCDQPSNTCQIQVPAPGFALVFLANDDATDANSLDPVTFSTTAVTKTANTATVDPSVLATSNGHSGSDLKHLGSTSQGSVSHGVSIRMTIGQSLSTMAIVLTTGLAFTLLP